MSEETRGGFKLNGEITLGSLLMTASIVVSLVGSAAIAVNRIDQIQSTIATQGKAFGDRLEKVETKLGNINDQIILLKPIESKFVDHETRIRDLERYIRGR